TEAEGPAQTRTGGCIAARRGLAAQTWGVAGGARVARPGGRRVRGAGAARTRKATSIERTRADLQCANRRVGIDRYLHRRARSLARTPAGAGVVAACGLGLHSLVPRRGLGRAARRQAAGLGPSQ